MDRRRHLDLHLAVLLAVCAVLLATLAPLLVQQDLGVGSPLVGGDTQDWVADGLAVAGADVHYSVRPPLLPVVIAGLDRLSALEVLPVLLLCLQLATAVVLYLYLRPRVPAGVALAVGVGMAGCFSWLGFGFQVMADVPAASLLFAGSVCFILGAERAPRWFVLAGLLLGLSAVTQQLALLFALPAASALVVHRRDLLRSSHLWVGTLLFLAPTLIWISYELAAFGTAGDVRVRHWSLLGLHLGGVLFSAVGGLSMIGLFGGVLAIIGLGLLAWRARTGFADTVVVGLVVVVAIFFVFGYRFHAKRLLVYLVPFWAVATAEALAWLRRPVWRGAVAVLVVTCAWLPLPGGPSAEGVAALWPLPALYLRTDTTGGVAPPSVTGPRLEVAGPSEVARWSLHALLMEHGPAASRGEVPDPQRFAADRAAVWIHDDAVRGGDRYGRGLRMGNLLRKRVSHVPLAVVRPLEPWLKSRFLTEVEGSRVYRAELSGVEGTWLLIVERGAEADAWVAQRQQPPRAEPTPGLASARRIVVEAGRRSMVVVTDEGGGPSVAVLPFLAAWNDLYIMDPAAYRTAAKAFGAVRGARLGVVGGTTLWDLDAMGRPFLLVDATRSGL